MLVSEVEVEVCEEMEEGLEVLGFWVCFETLVTSMIVIFLGFVG